MILGPIGRTRRPGRRRRRRPPPPTPTSGSDARTDIAERRTEPRAAANYTMEDGRIRSVRSTALTVDLMQRPGGDRSGERPASLAGPTTAIARAVATHTLGM